MSDEQITLLQELAESRMYRGASTLKGKSAKEIAEIAYVMFLTIEIVRMEDPHFVKTYITNTTAYDNFETIRLGSTDLHNLIAVLHNQDDYSDRIATNPHISIPLLQTKKYFRDAEQGYYAIGVIRRFILKLEGFLNISESWMKSSRRAILYWDNISESEKRKVILNIRNYFQRHSFNNDLYVYFKRKFH